MATAAPGNHHVLARIEAPLLQANYLPVDEPVTDASQFQTFRVRFRLHNAGTAAITTSPQLEYRTEGTGGYFVVPEKPLLGVPFHVSREWVPSLSLGGGTMQGELGEDIAVADLQIGAESGLAVNGHRSMGANPDRAVTLPADSYTEQEFTVTLSVDAQYLTSYELRITDGESALTGTDVATIRLGSPPAVRLSEGQRQGVAVVDPLPATGFSGSAYPLLSAPAIAANVTVSAATEVAADIHGPYTLMSDQCAVCHRGHSAKAPNLLVKASGSELCFACHDGTAANANVLLQYSPAVPLPVNDPVKREYYSHDAEAAGTHTRSELDEFGIVAGEPNVPNRHSSCADCHNSHQASGTDSIQTTTGWTASGPLAGISGVSVANGLTPNSAPLELKFLDGVTDVVTREYQLCFKCHSGSTTLPPAIAGKPSKDLLDKAVEFNPANPSFHPIEAPGTNQTAAMTASLDKSSPYKLWNFNIGSTVRCVNCHAGGAPDPTAAPVELPLPGSALAPHASSNRGILLENYRDRVLKPSTAASATDSAYSAGDFALCYVCHGEEPFAPNGTASNGTNFALHSKHLTGLGAKGDKGTDIDTAGDGQGNAVCAECHFRIHSTTNKVDAKAVDGSAVPQAIPGSRLVNFAPNVQPFEPLGATAKLSWTPGDTSGGSCTLTCHGYEHDSAPYSPPSAAPAP